MSEKEPMRKEKKMKKFLVAGIMALVLAAFSTDLFAAQGTSSLGVSASVTNTCTISTAAIAFGAYDPLSASPNDNTGGVTITCTSGAGVTIELDDGANYLAPNRRMVSGLNFLNYEIYQDAGRTTRWGSVAAAQNKSATGTGAADTHTAYGRIPALQNLPAGSFTDTIVAAVNF